jgi:hypothetical protein
MLMISDSTILKLATPMLNSCFYVFCVAYVSSSSYHPTDNLKKVKKFKVQICGMHHYLIPCILVVQTIISICANARFGTTIEIPLDGAVVPLSFP